MKEELLQNFQSQIRFINFYRKQADLSLIAADILYNISTEKAAKEFHKLDEDYECYLWVINSSYYSMFYAVNALLAYREVRILSEQGIHKTSAHALVYFCVKNNFIAKELYEQFVESQQEAVELLNFEEFKKKAKDLIDKYFYEAEKRSRFTYETEEGVKQRYANTSLQRAKEFFNKKNEKYIYLIINNLLKKEEIKKNTRGYYTINEDPSLMVFCLKPAYLGLQDALSIHNLWEQETNPVVITTKKIRQGVRKVFGNNVFLRRISGKYLFGVDYIKQGDFYYPYSDIEKTLIDMFYYKQYMDEELLKNFKKRIDKKKLNNYLKKYPKKLAESFKNKINLI